MTLPPLSTKPTISFLASHNGSSMRAIITAIKNQEIAAHIGVIISNNAGSGALRFAQEHGLAHAHISRLTHGSQQGADQAIAQLINTSDVVALSGYMRPLGAELIRNFPGTIINIHPALLPDFGGQGMYGSRVHEAVVAAGATQTGITIHTVDEQYDHGTILAQKIIPLHPDDTAAIVEEKVRAVETQFYVDTVRELLTPTAS